VKLKADLEWQKRPTSRCPERKGDNADLQSMLADAERRLKDTAQKCQDPITGLQKSMVERNATLTQTREEDVRVVATLQGELRAETARATACETKNAELYAVTLDLIKRHENRGIWEKFLLAEPFTGLQSVEVENLEDFREKAAAQNITPKKD